MRQQEQFYSVSRQWLVRTGSAHINILEQLQLNITGLEVGMTMGKVHREQGSLVLIDIPSICSPRLPLLAGLLNASLHPATASWVCF